MRKSIVHLCVAVITLIGVDQIAKRVISSFFEAYLKNNKDKLCESMAPVFSVGEYREYPNTEVRKVTSDEIERYMSERVRR